MSTLIYPIRELSTPAPRLPWRVFDRPFLLLWGYLLVVALAEVLTALVSAELGMILHALLLVGLTIRGASWQLGAERRLAMALTMAPLTRLISLAMPLTNLPQMAWYPIVSVPLLIAAWLIIRQLRVSRAELGLRSGNLPLQLMLMGCGLGLGFVEYIILAPPPLTTEFSWSTLALSAALLAVSTGFTEELIFRGLLQSVATPTLGRWALVYVSLLFAALHIGYLSFLDIVFVFGVGLLFAHIVRWSGSILGVSLAHGATNVTLFLIMPYLARYPTGAVAAIAPWVIWGGIAITIVAVHILILRASLAQPAARTASLTPTNIRALRRDAGLTYADLAARSGVPARTIAEIEHGLCSPRPEYLLQIAEGLGVTPQSLIPIAA
jgi:membrane protease YdiL (CAAX protease family)/DNA-binding XRE family transcriptional regulator